MFTFMNEHIRAVCSRILKRYPTSHISFSSKLGRNINLEGFNLISEGVRIDNVSMGKYSYIAKYGDISNTKIGRYTSIGPRCIIESAGNHPTNTFVSTHPCFYSSKPHSGYSYISEDLFEEFKYIDVAKRIMVEIGNDVWIASDVKILPGIKIGDGAIIAAGAVVTKNVPNYAIVGGVPAKVLKYRFEDAIINSLNELQWWNKNEKWLKEFSKYFYDINELLRKRDIFSI